MARSTLDRDFDIARNLSGFERRITILERIVLFLRFLNPPGVVYDTGWTQAGSVLGTNWESFSPTPGNNNYFEFRRVGSIVHLRGLLRREVSAATGTITVVTLPVGFRPSSQVLGGLMTNALWVTGAASSGTAHTHNPMSSGVQGPTIRYTVGTDGTVEVTVPTTVSMNVGLWVSVGEISFMVDL